MKDLIRAIILSIKARRREVPPMPFERWEGSKFRVHGELGMSHVVFVGAELDDIWRMDDDHD